MIKNILIVDTETTGLDSLHDQVIEVAAVLYSVEHKTILQQISTLLPVTHNPAQSVNKISSRSSAVPMAWLEITKTIVRMASFADAVVAHNAEFDKQWMIKACTSGLIGLPWICTLKDFKWPRINTTKPGSGSLVSIAIALDVPVVSAHRALTDCQLLTSSFSKLDDLSDRIESALNYARAEKFIYQALVSISEKDLAKAAGFSWSQPHLMLKTWAKIMTEEEAAEIKEFELKMIRKIEQQEAASVPGKDREADVVEVENPQVGKPAVDPIEEMLQEALVKSPMPGQKGYDKNKDAWLDEFEAGSRG